MPNLTVRIISPREEVFKGEAASVSSTNSAGNFDILPEHAKFVTLVEKKPIVVRSIDGKTQEFEYDMAIIHVHANQVDIFINPSESVGAT